MIVLRIHVSQPLLLSFPHLARSRRRWGGRGAVRVIIVGRARRSSRYGRGHLGVPSLTVISVPRTSSCEACRGQRRSGAGSTVNSGSIAPIRTQVRPRTSQTGTQGGTRSCARRSVACAVCRLLGGRQPSSGVLRHFRGGLRIAVRVDRSRLRVYQVGCAGSCTLMTSRRVELEKMNGDICIREML
jgi:hypothetical protein